MSEIGDFNYVDLLNGNSVKSTDTNSIHCNPQITLIENKDKKIVMEVIMSVNDTAFVPFIPRNLPRLIPKKKRSIKRIEFLSCDFPTNSWVHCVLQGNEIMVKNEPNTDSSSHNNSINNDDKNDKNKNTSKSNLETETKLKQELKLKLEIEIEIKRNKNEKEKWE